MRRECVGNKQDFDVSLLARYKGDTKSYQELTRNLLCAQNSWACSKDYRENLCKIAKEGTFSLIETAKMNDINPHLFLKKLLETMQDHNHKKKQSYSLGTLLCNLRFPRTGSPYTYLLHHINFAMTITRMILC